MERRLYFLAPDMPAARQIVEELQRAGVPAQNIHAIGPEYAPVEGLPAPTRRQTQDSLHTIEQVFWKANLAVFGSALLGLMLAVYAGRPVLAVVCVGVMVGTFVLGLADTRLPDVRLREFREALRHGEILVFADVPKERVQALEDRVRRHHPGVAIGGVSWTVGALDL